MLNELLDSGQYEKIADLCATNHHWCDWVWSGLHSNPRDYQKYIPILKYNYESLKIGFPSWVIFRAFVAGVITETQICSAPITLNLPDRKSILLNWPEMESKHPMLIHAYPATRQYLSTLKEYRLMEMYGVEERDAILADDPRVLGDFLAKPNYVLSNETVSRVIRWNAIACFHFLLINEMNVPHAFHEALSCQRTEMLEVLVQHGLPPGTKLPHFSLRYCTTDILEWLQRVDFMECFNLAEELAWALMTPNVHAVNFLSPLYGDQPPTERMCKGAIENGFVDLIEKWPHLMINHPQHLIQRAPKHLLYPHLDKIAFIFVLERVPFDRELADLGRAPDGEVPSCYIKSVEALKYVLERNIHIRWGYIYFDFCEAVNQQLLTFTQRATGISQPLFWSCKDLPGCYAAGADITFRDDIGWTILHHRCNDPPDIDAFLVEQLINLGADPTIVDNYDMTALDLYLSCFDLTPPTTDDEDDSTEGDAGPPIQSGVEGLLFACMNQIASK